MNIRNCKENGVENAKSGMKIDNKEQDKLCFLISSLI